MMVAKIPKRFGVVSLSKVTATRVLPKRPDYNFKL